MSGLKRVIPHVAISPVRKPAGARGPLPRNCLHLYVLHAASWRELAHETAECLGGQHCRMSWRIARRYSSDVTISLMVSTSARVSCCGEDRGQEGKSSRPHSSSRFHEWYRDCDKRKTRSTVRSGRPERDRSIARSSEIFVAPSRSRAWAKEKPDTLVITTTSRKNATSRSTRMRRASTSR